MPLSFLYFLSLREVIVGLITNQTEMGLWMASSLAQYTTKDTVFQLPSRPLAESQISNQLYLDAVLSRNASMPALSLAQSLILMCT